MMDTQMVSDFNRSAVASIEPAQKTENTTKPLGYEGMAPDDNGSAGQQHALAGARVIFVLGPLILGGSERQALLFARYLKNEQQADVQIWGTVDGPGRLASLCDQHGIPWRIVPFAWRERKSKNLMSLARFAWQLRRARPYLILPYMETPNLLCGAVWRWTGARLCVWNQRDDGIARVNTRHGAWAIRNTPRFISNSEKGAEHLVTARGVASRSLRVVHNGIELAPPQADRHRWREQLGIGEDWFAACMVANLTDYKDHATLLRAWQIVRDHLETEEGPTPVLLLAGRFDTNCESLKALAYDLRLDRSVRLLGPVDDVAGLLKASDAGILCSNSEGSPNSVLEYMAAELAVTGTDIPGMREALSPENHLLLAPPENPRILAAHIVELATDRRLRERLGSANHRRVLAEFGPRRMCLETMEVIVGGLRDRGSLPRV